MAGSIEIFPRTYIGADYTQTVDEAVDVGGANFAALQLWFEPALSGSPRTAPGTSRSPRTASP